MKHFLETLKTAEMEANKLDELWGADPDNEELESQWDTAYKAQHKAFSEAVAEIVRITSGQIDNKTAASMLRAKRSEVEKLFE